MKKILLWAAALTLAAQTPAMSQEIVVGFQTSLTGAAATLGVPLNKGMLTAQAAMPEVAGHKIKVVTLDDGSDPSAATRNARKLIDEYKADILIGTAGSPMTTAIASVSQETRVPFIAISPIAMPKDQSDWHVVINQPATLMVDAVIAHMKKAGIKTVGFIGFADTWGDLVANALTKGTADGSIKVVASERYARSDPSVNAQILRILTHKPEAILNGGAAAPGALPYIALADRGYKGPVFGTHALVTDDFIRIGGKAVNGAIAPTGPVVVGQELPDSNPIRATSAHYQETYRKVNGEIAKDAMGPYTYDAYTVFVEAAKKALAKGGKPGTPEFRTALRDEIVSTKNLVGLHGIFNYTPGQPYGVDERSRVLVQLKDGDWHLYQE